MYRLSPFRGPVLLEEEDPDIARLIDLVSGAPVYRSYRELLASQFKKGPLRFYTDSQREGGYDDERDRFELYSKGSFSDGVPYKGDCITFFASKRINIFTFAIVGNRTLFVLRNII